LHATARQIGADAFEINLRFDDIGWRCPFHYEEGYEEHMLAGFKPDVVTRLASGEMVAIEIFVTHAVGAEKAAKYRKAKVTCVELDLTKVRRSLAYEELRRRICEGSFPARVVHDEALGIRESCEAALATFRPRKFAALQKRRQEERRRLAETERTQGRFREMRDWLRP